MRKFCLTLGWVLWATGIAWLLCYSLAGFRYKHVHEHTSVDPIGSPYKGPVPVELANEMQAAMNQAVDFNVRGRISIFKPTALILAGTFLLVWRPKGSKDESVKT